jgi:catechol 2,3-dioxygenase-like lactoylglutathione lyase family enzyme
LRREEGTVAKRRTARATKSKAGKNKARTSEAGKSATAVEFNHAMVYVRDLAAALQFYAGHLGFKVVDEYPGAYARLQSPKGATTLALHVAKPEESVASDGVRLYFEVEALDEICAKLESAGVRIAEAPKIMPWGWQHAYLKDPDGHEISLYWAGKKRFQKTVMKRSAGA